MQQLILNEIDKLAGILIQIRNDAALLQQVETIAECCVRCLQQGNKIMLAGNGGSAADAQHLAAELVSRLRYNRPGLAAIALTTDTSALTAIGNDYAFEQIFSRQVESIGRAGDILIGISTSGKSANILRALASAQAMGITTIGFTRDHAPLMSERCDHVLSVPSQDTQKIQECHILFGHIVCGLIEEIIFGKQFNPQYQQKVEMI